MNCLTFPMSIRPTKKKYIPVFSLTQPTLIFSAHHNFYSHSQTSTVKVRYLSSITQVKIKKQNNNFLLSTYPIFSRVLISIEMMMSALYRINTLSWICIMLAHINNSPQVDMLIQIYAIFANIGKLSLTIETPCSFYFMLNKQISGK